MREKLLAYLYRLFANEGPYVGGDVTVWLRQNLDDEDDADELLLDLEDNDLVCRLELPDDETVFCLTARGVIEVERLGCIRTMHPIQFRRERMRVVDRLARGSEKRGLEHFLRSDDVADQARLSMPQYFRAAFVLAECGFLCEPWNAPSQRISLKGFEAWSGFREQVALWDGFHALQVQEDISPQERGHRLEQLLACCFRTAGWNAETNVRATTEENDVAIAKGREIYIVQCKWQRHPVSSAVQHMIGRLGARTAVDGLLFSMSGFTAPAVQEAREAIGRQLVTLWGTGDTSTIVHFPGLFENLLQKKLYAARVRRKVLIDGTEH